MGTFSCEKCGAMICLMYYNRHICGAKGPEGGYADRPDGQDEISNPELLKEYLDDFNKHREKDK